MFTLFVLFVFAWLFVKSVGLAFHATWGLAKFVATLLFVIALPLLVVFAVVGALLPLLLPLASCCRLLHSEKGIKYPTAVRPGAARRFLVIEVSAWYTCSQGVLRLLSSNKEVFPMKLVVCFPGIGYHCDKPLLYYSRKLAACAGYDHTLLLQYAYHKDGLRGSPAALREAFDTLYAQAEAQMSAIDWPQYDDVLFLSKSIGTAVSTAFAQRHGIPCRQILYTPLSLTFALAPQNALAFLGTADPWSDASSVAAAAHANGTPLCLYENANHSLETGDVLHDLATLQDVMQKTQTFIADTPH